MTHIFRRIAMANLAVAINDPRHREQNHSTLIASDWMLIEAPWDGMAIGDVQVYLNKNVNVNNVPLRDGSGNAMPAKWEWWTGVPRGSIRNYTFEKTEDMYPKTVGEEENPFLVTSKKNAQRETQPRSTG